MAAKSSDSFVPVSDRLAGGLCHLFYTSFSGKKLVRD
jgi:hypothetical protein